MVNQNVLTLEFQIEGEGGINGAGWGMLMEKSCSGSKYACIMLIY